MFYKVLLIIKYNTKLSGECVKDLIRVADETGGKFYFVY
jgi:hypothetical protein